MLPVFSARRQWTLDSKKKIGRSMEASGTRRQNSPPKIGLLWSMINFDG